MKATIERINDSTVDMLLNSKTITVPKTKLKFDYAVGDTIDIRRMGDEFVFIKQVLDVPQSKRKVKKERNALKTTFKIAIPLVVTIIGLVALCITAPSQVTDYSDYQPDASKNERSEVKTKENNKTDQTENDTEDSTLDIPAPPPSTDDGSKTFDRMRSIIDGTQSEDYQYTQPTPQTPSNNNYYVPDTTNYDTPEMTCDDYHAQYYQIFESSKRELTNEYNQLIDNASNQCVERHQDGCPQATRLRQQLDVEITRLKTTYKSNMQTAGCEPR